MMQVRDGWDTFWQNTRISLEENKKIIKDESNSLMWKKIKRCLVDRFGSLSGLKVIEIGSGRGEMSVLLAQQGAKITLLDKSQYALKLAEKLFQEFNLKVDLIEGDIFSLSNSLTQQFDVSMSFGLVEHFKFPQRQEVFDVHYQLLRPGGVSIIHVPNLFCPVYWIFKFICHATGHWKVGFDLPFRPRELSFYAEKSGYKNIQLFHSSLIYDTLHLLLFQPLFHILGKEVVCGLRFEMPTLMDKLFSAWLTAVVQREKRSGCLAQPTENKDVRSQFVKSIIMQSNLENVLICPVCQERLIKSNEHYHCLNCLKNYPIRAGIPCFVEGESKWRILEPQGRKELLKLCRIQGWRRALTSYLTDSDKIEWIAGEKRFPLQILANVDRNAKVLDMGCGWGKTGFQVAKFYKEIYCVDVEFDGLEFMTIRAAQENIDNVIPIQVSAFKTPFPDNFFELVFLNGALEWTGTFQDNIDAGKLQELALKEIARVIKPDGILFVGIENRYGLQYIAGFTEEHTGLKFISLLPRSIAKLYHRIMKGEDYRALTYSRRTLNCLLNKAGFKKFRWFALFPNYGFFRIAASIDTKRAILFLLTEFKIKPFRITRKLAQKLLNVAALFSDVIPLLSFFSPAWGVFTSKRNCAMLKFPIQTQNLPTDPNSEWVININPHRALFLLLKSNSIALQTKYIFPLTDEKREKHKRRQIFVEFLKQAHPGLLKNLPHLELCNSYFGSYTVAKGVNGRPISLTNTRAFKQFFALCLSLSTLKVYDDNLTNQLAGYDLRPNILQIAKELNLFIPILEQKGIFHGDLTCSNILVSSERIVLLDWEDAGFAPGIFNWYDFLLKNIIVIPLRLPAAVGIILRQCRFLPGKKQAKALLSRFTVDMLKGCGIPLKAHRNLLLIYLGYLCEQQQVTIDKTLLFEKLLQEDFLLRA